MKMKTVKVHFDGKALVLDEPVDLPVNVPLVADVKEPVVQTNDAVVKRKRVWGQFGDKIWISPDFDDPLPDSFWGFDK